MNALETEPSPSVLLPTPPQGLQFRIGTLLFVTLVVAVWGAAMRGSPVAGVIAAVPLSSAMMLALRSGEATMPGLVVAFLNAMCAQFTVVATALTGLVAAVMSLAGIFLAVAFLLVAVTPWGLARMQSWIRDRPLKRWRRLRAVVGLAATVSEVARRGLLFASVKSAELARFLSMLSVRRWTKLVDRWGTIRRYNAWRREGEARIVAR